VGHDRDQGQERTKSRKRDADGNGVGAGQDTKPDNNGTKCTHTNVGKPNDQNGTCCCATGDPYGRPGDETTDKGAPQRTEHNDDRSMGGTPEDPGAKEATRGMCTKIDWEGRQGTSLARLKGAVS